MLELVWLIPLFPLLAFAAIVFFLNRHREVSSWTAIGAMGLSLLLSAGAFFTVLAEGAEHFVKKPFTIPFEWAIAGKEVIRLGVMIDPLTLVMLFVVTFVGLNIFVYSRGYMRHEGTDAHGHRHVEYDKRYSRFFAYLSLFGAAMLGLVLADNLLLLFISWELVGLCSYLLIGFWFDKPLAETVEGPAAEKQQALSLLEHTVLKPSWPKALFDRVLLLPYPPEASKKAFLTTRVGDVSFLLGLILLFVSTGHLDFAGIFKTVHELGQHDPTLVTIAAILIFGGAVGKSAQFPLHVWLPDAMAGPTPVSALIHAATMVAAGVYLVARTFPIFEAAGETGLTVVLVIGTITALMAALIALGVKGIKQVMAYSTISQLGYMMVGLALGGPAVGIFHLMTHAFFKALLFLGSGSVIHGTGTEDIYNMGGLRRKMPTTFLTLTIGAASLAGFPFVTAGFWSKDEILFKALEHNLPVFIVMYFTAFLTAFYVFRAIFTIFSGEHPRDHHLHAHESPAVMTVPLIVLAIGSIVLGWVGMPFANLFGEFMGEHHAGLDWRLTTLMWLLSAVASLGGIGLAYLLYGRRPVASFAEDPLQRLGVVYTVIKHKFYVDEVYSLTVVAGTYKLIDFLRAFDLSVIDGLVNLVGKATLSVFSLGSRWVDTYLVDGAVNLSGWLAQQGGRILRAIQTGRVQNYGLVLFAGIALLLVPFYMKPYNLTVQGWDWLVALLVLALLVGWWLSRRTPPEPVPVMEAPAAQAALPADDLQVIEGIGPKIAGLLQAANITTFDQLAGTDVNRLRQILAEAGLARLADPETWPKQAELAATGKWSELAALQSQLKGGRRQ